MKLVENTMYLFDCTIKTSSNVVMPFTFVSDEQLVKTSEDLFGNESKELNTSCDAFKYFHELFDKRIIEGLDLRDNFQRALARRKRKAEGIKVVYTLDGVRHYLWVWFETKETQSNIYR